MLEHLTRAVLVAAVLQAAPALAAEPAGWRLLFDGHTTWGWHALALPEISPECWQVKDGLLLSLAPSGPHVANADIVSDGSYSSFELRAEFRLSPGANSGIKYFLRPDVRADGGVSSVGYEYQLIDDLAPDARAGENGRARWPRSTTCSRPPPTSRHGRSASGTRRGSSSAGATSSTG